MTTISMPVRSMEFILNSYKEQFRELIDKIFDEITEKISGINIFFVYAEPTILRKQDEQELKGFIKQLSVDLNDMGIYCETIQLSWNYHVKKRRILYNYLDILENSYILLFGSHSLATLNISENIIVENELLLVKRLLQQTNRVKLVSLAKTTENMFPAILNDINDNCKLLWEAREYLDILSEVLKETCNVELEQNCLWQNFKEKIKEKAPNPLFKPNDLPLEYLLPKTNSELFALGQTKSISNKIQLGETNIIDSNETSYKKAQHIAQEPITSAHSAASPKEITELFTDQMSKSLAHPNDTYQNLKNKKLTARPEGVLGNSSAIDLGNKFFNFSQKKQVSHNDLINTVISLNNYDIEETINISEKLLQNLQRHSTHSNIFNIRQPKSNFIGRYSQIQQLSQLFDYEKCSAMPIPSLRAVITGQGGIGKTELSILFGHLKSNDYQDRVRFIHADNLKVMEDSFRQLGRDLGIIIDALKSEEIVYQVYFKLSQMGRSLLIFDNATSYHAIENYLPTKYVKQNCDILISSRTASWPSNGNYLFEILYLSELNIEEAVAFILKELRGNGISITDAKHLAQNLEYFPLALQQAVAYIARAGISVKRFLIEYYRLVKLESPNSDTHFASSSQPNNGITTQQMLKNIWNIIIRGIQNKSFSTLSNQFQDALETLNIMAYLHANDIPESLFETALDKERAVKAIDLLEAYSIITKTEQQTLAIHSLVQEIIRQHHQETMANSLQARSNHYFLENKFLKKAIKLINQQFNYNRNKRETIHPNQIYLLHVQVLWNFIKQYKLLSETVGQLLCKYGQYYLYEKRDFDLAEEVLSYAMSVLEQFKGSRAESLADAYISLGFINILNKNDITKAVNYAEKAKELYQQESIGMALVLNLYGIIESYKEINLQAKEMYWQSIKIEESLNLPTKTPLYAINHTNLAHEYLRETNYKEALIYAEQALSLYKEIYGTCNHLDVINTLLLKAHIYTRENRTIEARNFHIKCINIYKNLYSLEECHTKLEFSVLIDALIMNLCDVGNFKEATKQYEDYLLNHKKTHLFKSKQVENYPILLQAKILNKMQNFDQAHQHLQSWLAVIDLADSKFIRVKIQEVKQILQQCNKPDEIAKFNKFMDIFWQKYDDYDSYCERIKICLDTYTKQTVLEALSYCDEAIEMDDTRYEAYYFKGICYTKLAEWEQALTSYNQVLAIRKDIWSAHSARGDILRGLNRYKEARIQYSEALSSLSKSLAFETSSNNNPNYGKVSYGFSICGFHLGDYEIAIEAAEQTLSIYKAYPNDTQISPLNIELERLLTTCIRKSLLLNKSSESSAQNYLEILKLCYDNTKSESIINQIVRLGIFYASYQAHATAFNYYQLALDNLNNHIGIKFAQIAYLYGKSNQDIQYYTNAIKYYKQALTIYTENFNNFKMAKFRVLASLAQCYMRQKNYRKAEKYFIKALILHNELTLLTPIERAKANLEDLQHMLCLENLEFDKNNTCIVNIDETFSVHITYEPNTQRLYLYSPLLDGLPIEPDKRQKLYEVLLEGSMLGRQMAGGGVGLALKEELILLHCVLDMKNPESSALVNFMPTYLAIVEKWQLQSIKISRSINLDTQFKYMPQPSYTRQSLLSELSLCYQALGSTFNALFFDVSMFNERKGLNNAKLNLKALEKQLDLDDLQFDKNNTCILGIDNTFSIHITYEPNTQRLYLYSPLLDGLPTESEKKLKLYETLLEGSMLGGQMAGGGVGLALNEELILLHCVLDMQQPDTTVLIKFLPLYISTVEKWQKQCANIIALQNNNDLNVTYEINWPKSSHTICLLNEMTKLSFIGYFKKGKEYVLDAVFECHNKKEYSFAIQELIKLNLKFETREINSSNYCLIISDINSTAKGIMIAQKHCYYKIHNSNPIYANPTKITYNQGSNSYQYFNAMQLELKRLNSLALPEALGGTNEIIQYLTNSIKKNEVVINAFEWDMYPDTSQTGDIQLESYNFPFESFINNFLHHKEKQKFLLPLLIMQAHFAGLVIIKQTDKWQVKYINPTGGQQSQKGEDKEALAKINQVLQKITAEHRVVFEEIKILSNNQQLNESDCAFIVAQSLVDIALEQEISIKPYTGDMTAYVKPIAKARAHFYTQERLGDNYESTIRDQLYSRLAKALTTNQDYVQELESFLRRKDINQYLLDDKIVKELNILLTQIESGTIANQLGTLLMDKATSFLNTSATLKCIELAEVRRFCDTLFEPHFTEEGSLIFKLNRDLQAYIQKRERHVNNSSLLKQTDSAYSRLFQPLSSKSTKRLESYDKAEKQNELAEIEEFLVNQAMKESKPI